MSVVWVFLDGVGIGSDDPAVNPWAAVAEPTLIAFEGHSPSYPGAVAKPLDATLGVPGLPQSATGTTALFTGINAPQRIGRHLSGFPTPGLLEIIREHSVHKQAKALGLTSTFANAFNDAYFRRPATRQSVTTHAVRAAGIPFRMMKDYREGHAVFHDLTGELVRLQGNQDKLTPPVGSKQVVFKRFVRDPDKFAEWLAKEDVPVIDPVEAGRRVAALAEDHDLVVFEYVKTDMAGHTQDTGWANDVVREVMLFLKTLLDGLDRDRATLLIASDHGNCEDLSVKTHTLNPVAACAVGAMAEDILHSCDSITDLVPAVLKAMVNGSS